MSQEQPGSPQNVTPTYYRSSQAWQPLLVFGALLLVIAVVANNAAPAERDDEDNSVPVLMSSKKSLLWAESSERTCRVIFVVARQQR
jgi:hypothetical protein